MRSDADSLPPAPSLSDEEAVAMAGLPTKTVDKGTVDKSTVDKSTVDKSTVDKSTVDKGTVDKGSQPTAATLTDSGPAYDSALNYLYGRINYEKIGNTPYNLSNYRLDRMRQLLDLLGNPQSSYEIIHVAGTKGKGTTATLLADCLIACGKRTGLYTSPHLLKLEERIQFQGHPCSPLELVELTQTVAAAAARLEDRGAGRATFFELTTAMGMLHFANRAAQAVVLEVGLGGRLDSTNVCAPLVSIITSISLDHQAQLGNTLGAIAREKAGIIKRGIPVICSARAEEARREIIAIAHAQAAPLRLIERDFHVDWQPVLWQSAAVMGRAEVTYRLLESSAAQSSVGHSPGHSLGHSPGSPPNHSLPWHWNTSLLGRHQADNIAAALATIELLRDSGWDLPIEKLKSAISRSQPPARLEVVAFDPVSIVDSAHNPASISAGLDALADHFPGCPLTVVFAASRDKDWRQMLAELLKRTHRLVLTAYQENPRGLPLGELWDAAQELLATTAELQSARPILEKADGPTQAWRLGQQQIAAGEVLYATGSFFLAAEIMAGRP